MEQVGLSALGLSDEMRIELLRRAVTLLTECRACEPAVAYLQDVEQRLSSSPACAINDLPDHASFLPQS
jgi:hypothetical protein